MPKARALGADIYYEVQGEGPPLLLVSGLGGSASFWSRQLETLARRFTVAVYDHRGVGRSTASPPPYSVQQMAADAAAVLDHLGWDRVRFVGHSTGGAIGQVLAAARPSRIERLVLSATWTHCDAYFRRLFSTRREVLLKAGPDIYRQLGSLLVYPPDWIAAHDAKLTETDAYVALPDVSILAARIDALLAFDGRDALEKILCPTLVLCAADDVVTPAYFSAALARSVRGAELCIFEKGGHYLPITDPDRFGGRIIEFLAGY